MMMEIITRRIGPDKLHFTKNPRDMTFAFHGESAIL
jgi:hypothetical protein